MPRDRFLNIMCFLHLADNDKCPARGQPGHDPVNKLGAPYAMLLKNFREVFLPGPRMCVDEGMIPYRGKIYFKCYMPDKPDKYGLKAFELCDGDTGYCNNFVLYTGARGVPASSQG